VTSFSVLALGMALLVAGIFEKAGLAMIVGAYVMGLSLARTDLRHVVQAELRAIHALFVPVFFTVMGMLVDLREVVSHEALVLGLAFSAAAIAAKVLGAGLPALAVNFNRLGALRIGLGMVPRSEVALIIAGTGLSYHVLTHATFGAAMMMVLLSVTVAPLFLDAALRDPRSGTRRPIRARPMLSLPFEFPSRGITDLVLAQVVESFSSEGFFVQVFEGDKRIYHIDKDDVYITMARHPSLLEFQVAEPDAMLVRTAMYEILLDLQESMGKLKHLAKPKSLARELTGATARKVDVGAYVDRSSVTVELRGRDKQEIIEELLGLLCAAGKVSDCERALQALLAREQSMSTGMQHGVALPHAKTDVVKRMVVAVGLKKAGVDFQSIDGEPSHIFVMILSPADVAGPHIQFLAGVSALLDGEESRKKLLASQTPGQIVAFFGGT
jgi:fructose-specific phosphotransferase system IIA component